MPYVIRPRQLRRIAAALFGTATLLGVVPALAAAAPNAACPASSTSTPFSAFGDGALYSLLAGGSFESGAPGWQLTNAEVVSNTASASSEPAPGPNALAIQPGGSALSPAFCINVEEPSFRFFARQTGGGRSSLSVAIVWSDAWGFRHLTTVASLTAGTAWAPTAVLPLATKLPLWMPGATLKAQLQFRAEGTGTWAIDDVYVDPHSR